MKAVVQGNAFAVTCTPGSYCAESCDLAGLNRRCGEGRQFVLAADRLQDFIEIPRVTRVGPRRWGGFFCLPAEEQAVCKKLWADVAARLKKI
jgi:hypothetical protein